MCRKCKGKNSGIANDVATGIHGLHTAADKLFWPLKPIDDVVHGFARGACDWLTDRHPRQDESSDSDCDGPPPPRRESHSSRCSRGGYPNTKRDVFTRNYGSSFGTVSGGGRVKDCAKFEVN